MVEIDFENGKYIINAMIETEVLTLDIAEVRKRFICDCEAAFALAIRDMVAENAFLRKAIKEQKEKE
jgi:hypothetical protein